MRRLVLSVLVLSLFVSGFARAQGTSPPSPVRQRIVDALLCRGRSLDILRELAADGPALRAAGVSVASVGDRLDERIVFVFDPRLELFGATTTRVMMMFDMPHEKFAAYVSADFTGDPQAMIDRLKLVRGAGTQFPIADFVTPWPEGETCPPQIGLTKLGRRRFALGCGWCPG